MTSTRAFRSMLRSICFPLAALALVTVPIAGQSAEADPTTSPSAPGPATSRGGRETPHHEAGSVEASAPAMRDKMFLRQAVTGGMLEVKLSELAQRKASGDDVKEFATHLIADHSRMDDSLRAAGESQGVMLPTKLPPQEQTVYERLNGLSGEEFDREYIKKIAEDHHRDLREFRSEAASTPDDKLRTTVQDGTKMIHQHMVTADQIARSKGVQTAYPARVAASTSPQ